MRLFRLTTLIIIWTAFFSLQVSCKDDKNVVEFPQIIPNPSSQIINEGHFTLSSSTGIIYPEDLKVSAEFLKSYVEQNNEIHLGKGNDIQFILDTTIENDEGYSLDILPNNIKIKAKTDQGAFYAVQTLRQLLPPGFENASFKANQVTIQCVSISALLLVLAK